MSDIFKILFNFSVTINLVIFVFAILIGMDPSSVAFASYNVLGSTSFVFNTAVVSFIGIMLALVPVGIKVVSSGLDSFSVGLVFKLTAYSVFWSGCSVFTLPYLLVLQTLGWLLWGVLTFFYALGMFMSLKDVIGSGETNQGNKDPEVTGGSDDA